MWSWSIVAGVASITLRMKSTVASGPMPPSTPIMRLFILVSVVMRRASLRAISAPFGLPEQDVVLIRVDLGRREVGICGDIPGRVEIGRYVRMAMEARDARWLGRRRRHLRREFRTRALLEGVAHHLAVDDVRHRL